MSELWNCCQKNFKIDFVISHLLNTSLHYSQHYDVTALFSAPFTYDVTKAEESLQMEPFEMESDSTLRARYLEVGVPGFLLYLAEEFKNFRKYASRIMAMFGSIYVCEQLFSFMRSTKTSQRTRLTDQHLSSLIKVGTAQTFQPDIAKIVSRKTCQASWHHYK
ncbi:hypothetical protein M514_24921 [Trichuris suis]|uniref:HAT C-terminal dimerisation domain-containing protein n=1 Tax=Trichuris suis TaxID=68888 RepID=A0A085N085_9BILA|nr:hypothetical protein M514_24921 [Trichuris suis]